MCELFAVNAARPVEVSGYLRTFYRHSDMHPHGWGISWRDEDGNIILHKEPVRAIDSPFLEEFLTHPLAKSQLLAHIRYATFGRTAYENCHPFTCIDYDGVEWMMIHNGSVFNDALITGYDRHEQGDTDSERVILFLMDLLDVAESRHNGSLDFNDRFDALNSALARLSNGNKLNIILDDGDYLYVHTNTMEKTLYVKREDRAAIFSTQPLDDSPAWQPVPTAQLQAYRKGELVREAMPHPNIFVQCALEGLPLLQTSA